MKPAAGKATEALNFLLPPLPADELGISPEDPIIGALRAGLSVNRLEFEQAYADMAVRSASRIIELEKRK